MLVVWTEAAATAVEHIFDYLFEFNPRAASHVAETLRDMGNSLVHFPYRGRPVPGTDLRELVAAYPYIIRYRVERDTVVILRVRHSSRRPTER